MTELTELALRFQERLNAISDRAARNAVRLWRESSPADLDASWDRIAPNIDRVMSNAQVAAASLASPYAARAMSLQGVRSEPVKVVPQAFAGVTREGREVVPELFSAVTATKSLIGRGSGVPAAFQAGTGLMSVLAANIVRDTGRMAASTAGVGRGALYSIRVVNAGACDRCAILAGVKGYRTNFQRHPRCRCTSMPLHEGEAPAGMYASADDYFESLGAAEQDRVFTKAGAEAIRLGADPIKVVNARRGAHGIGYSSHRNVPWTPGNPRGRLMPVTIGIRADGSPLQVFATTEGTTARSSWARAQGDLRKGEGRYRRTQRIRLMPETIMSMSTDVEHARKLLMRYGYLA